MRQPEIILNLWYVYDDKGFIYSLRARAYLGLGDDQENLALLQKFAPSFLEKHASLAEAPGTANRV